MRSAGVLGKSNHVFCRDIRDPHRGLYSLVENEPTVEMEVHLPLGERIAGVSELRGWAKEPKSRVVVWQLRHPDHHQYILTSSTNLG